MRLTALLPPLLTDPVTAQTVRAAAAPVRTDRTVVVAPGARPAVLAAMALGEDGVAAAAGQPSTGTAASTRTAAGGVGTSQSRRAEAGMRGRKQDGGLAGPGGEGPEPGAGGAEPRPGRQTAGGTPLLVVTATGREADQLAAALGSYLPDSDVAVLPAWETLPHERLSPRADTVARRLAVLRRLAHPEDAGAADPGATGAAGAAQVADGGPSSGVTATASGTDPAASGTDTAPEAPSPDAGSAAPAAPTTPPAPAARGPIRVLVVPVRALLAPVIAGLGDLEPVHLAPGTAVSLEEVAHRLAEAAYTRVDMVESRGQYAVRGGILDVFPPTEPRPVRVDFFGDEVEEVSSFAVADQRTIEALPSVTATACRELVLTPQVRERARGLIDSVPGAADMLERISQGVPVEGMESLAPVLVDAMVPLLDLVGDRLVVLLEPERVRRRAEDLAATTSEFLAAAWTSAASGGTAPIDLSAAAFARLAEARALALGSNLGWWSLTSLPADPDDEQPALADPRSYRGELDAAVRDIGEMARQGWAVVVATDGPGPGRRMAQLLADGDVPARIVTQLSETAELGWAGSPQAPDGGAPHGDGVVRVTQASAGHGFLAEGPRLALLAESDLTGRAPAAPRERRSLPARRTRRSVDPLSLRAGDLVVHAQHGVGRFIELTRRGVGSGQGSRGKAGKAAASREYLVIEYASTRRGQPGDRLLVPTDALDQVTKYVGGDNPALNRMGGADWQRTKSRARRAVREIASELVRLYAARSATTGHAFSPDTPWQAELEEAFAYTETPDQLSTIEDVKADMERPQPMDRLICGDVGYGKTEIAVRAAFKAVQDGKQVAVLVPTTLLVSQHAETFTERYAGFPVTVGQLSRFQDAQESAKVLDGLASGSIDVVIGTHRLITGQVRFKDLGLVIIDEEQRFGVEHKETLKALRTDVDVLSMSATPIPRTLEMAVTGLREMSTLATPPEDRHPILTYVGRYETRQVSAAIRRELLRDGQVFYVHNRVEDIDTTAARLAELVPEARVATAHGQMGEQRLERIIDSFWRREIDVLVCTTIVETGLDVTDANTLIVDRADRMGLSQLHQLRGRVGRGRERAYAYFLYPADTPLTETALERLRTVASNTDLGAGMQVAMKDLEIRGAGNLLGGEQSGHVAGVGFDLYVRMVADAVAAYKRSLTSTGGAAPGQAAGGSGDTGDTGGDDEVELRVELPVDATVPEEYIPHERLRLEAYTRFAAARSDAEVDDVLEELTDRYGPVPEPTRLLAALARLRALAARLGVTEIVAQGKSVRFAPVDLTDSGRTRVARLYPGTVIKPATRTIVVPAPGATARMGSGAVTGEELLAWAEVLLHAVVAGDESYDAEATRYRRRR